jgi:hypothetical protein
MAVYRVTVEHREALANAAVQHLAVEPPTPPDTFPTKMTEPWAGAIFAMVGEDFETGVEVNDPEQAAAIEGWVAEHAPGAVTRS